MPRPCETWHEFRPGSCNLCRLWRDSPPHRLLWTVGAAAPAPKARPVSEWPLPARVLARLRKPGDAGLGDTVARVLAKKGGDLWKKLYKKITGQDCGCGDRQAKLNALYPYPPEA